MEVSYCDLDLPSDPLPKYDSLDIDFSILSECDLFDLNHEVDDLTLIDTLGKRKRVCDIDTESSDTDTPRSNGIASDHKITSSRSKSSLKISTLPMFNGPNDINVIYNMPYMLIEALNGGSFETLRSIINRVVDPNVHIVQSFPNLRTDNQGSYRISDFLKAVVDTHPDIIATMKKIDLIDCGSRVKVIAHTRCRGTIIPGKCMRDVFGISKTAILSDLLFDENKTSPEFIDQQRAIEIQAQDAGKNIQFFIKSRLEIEYDTKTKLIWRQWSHSRLSSLRMVNAVTF